MRQRTRDTWKSAGLVALVASFALAPHLLAASRVAASRVAERAAAQDERDADAPPDERADDRAPLDGLLIEAEAFTSCDADVPPRRHDLAWASGRTALIRYPGVERIRWDVELEDDVHADLWLRYASKTPTKIAWRLDDAPFVDAPLDASGGFEGRDAWRWQRLGSIEARAGRHTVELGGAPIRPDCLWIGTATGAEPAWPRELALVPLDEDVLETLARTPPRAAPGWLEDAAAIAPPSWIENGRVGLHTRLSVAWTDRPQFEVAERVAASLGASSVVRHVKAMNGQCFWPSSLGAVADWVRDAERDPVRAMAERAAEAGVAFVAYYRHQQDRPLAEEHPDWVCVDAQGRTIRRAGEASLCYHSPFGDATLARIVELAERGAAGLYLDESHQPLGGCWCRWTRAAFEAATGLPMPAAPLLEDPLYRRFLAFTEDSLVAELWRWRSEVRARFPEFAFLVSTQFQPGLAEPLPTLRLASIADAVKTEYDLGARRAFGLADDASTLERDRRIALGWALARDGAFGRPAHVWIHALSSPERWRAAAAAVVAAGCYANLDHPEASLPDPETFAPAYALANELAVPLAGARPARDVLVHLPERERGHALADAGLAAFLATWDALCSTHGPVSFVGDDQLALLGSAEGEGEARALARVWAAGVPHRAVSPKARFRLSAPPRAVATWFDRADGSLAIGLSNAPGWVLHEDERAPDAITDARLFVASSARPEAVSWPGEVVLDAEATDDGWAVTLPAFQDAIVVVVR